MMCGILLDDGTDCRGPVNPDAPLNLCDEHFALAYEWQAALVGAVPEIMPAPCRACGYEVGKRYAGGWICDGCGYRPDQHGGPSARVVVVPVVYYVRFGNRIKIGTTMAPRTRFSSLPIDEVLAFERGSYELERRRHEQFSAHRVNGEWFDVHGDLMAFIGVLRAGVDDPWAQYEFWLRRERNR